MSKEIERAIPWGIIAGLGLLGAAVVLLPEARRIAASRRPAAVKAA